MAAREGFRRQVVLLVQILPFVADEGCFALKGGTAINLFHRDLPRLSVDIDLTYLPIEDRTASLTAIGAAMRRIADSISSRVPRSHVHALHVPGSNTVTKLNVRTPDAQVKLEVTPVLRGCVYTPEARSVSARVEQEFGFAEMQLLPFPDLFAGKIVAALDRQHPRDLFDVRDLLANEGISDELRTAFIVYLISHNRPISEVIAPSRKDISREFERGFRGMTEHPVSIEELLDARERLIKDIVGNMPRGHKHFLLSFEAGNPDWSLLDVPNAEQLPAVRWRMENLARLRPERRSALLQDLETALELSRNRGQ